ALAGEGRRRMGRLVRLLGPEHRTPRSRGRERAWIDFFARRLRVHHAARRAGVGPWRDVALALGERVRGARGPWEVRVAGSVRAPTRRERRCPSREAVVPRHSYGSRPRRRWPSGFLLQRRVPRGY